MKHRTQDYWIKKKQEDWIEISTFGQRFKTENASGYFYKGKEHYDWIRGPRIEGKNYKPSCGCAVPPWEACLCSVLLAEGERVR